MNFFLYYQHLISMIRRNFWQSFKKFCRWRSEPPWIFRNLRWLLTPPTDQFVTCLVLPECLSVKIAFHPRTVKRIVMAPMPSLLFRCFFSCSASFKNSSPREKVGNRLRFGTGVWSLCFYPFSLRNIWIFFPTLTIAARAKKKFLAKRFAHAISARVHHRDLEHAYVTEFDCVALLAML